MPRGGSELRFPPLLVLEANDVVRGWSSVALAWEQGHIVRVRRLPLAGFPLYLMRTVFFPSVHVDIIGSNNNDATLERCLLQLRGGAQPSLPPAQ